MKDVNRKEVARGQRVVIPGIVTDVSSDGVTAVIGPASPLTPNCVGFSIALGSVQFEITDDAADEPKSETAASTA